MSIVPRTGLRLQFLSDPGEFLAAAGDYLAADPVVSTVVTTIAHRLLSQQAEGIPQPDRNWWLVVSDESGAVVGAGMRTAPFAPYPPFLLPMPDEAAVALAHALHERGEEVLAVNGALPAVELCAAELARLGGGRVEVAQHTRLHELGELTWPAPVPGGLVAATEDDVELVTRVVRRVHGRRRRTGGPPARCQRARSARPRGDAAPDPSRTAVVLGRRDRGAGAPHRRQPAVVRGGPRGPGVHAAGPARARLGQQRGRRGFPPDPGRGRAGLPVHRPGQPDVEQDLRRPRLPAGRRHGQPGHRG